MSNRFAARWTAAVFAFAVATTASAQCPLPEGHPRIALVLGGGGAKGLAHLGVLEVLERERVPIDSVVGTSMGAIVGGLYSTGLTAEEITVAVDAVNWSEAFTDRAERRTKSFRRKQDDTEFLVKSRLRLKGGRIIIPPGALEGRKVVYLLRSLVGPGALTAENFADLPVPFAAVATDLESGTAKVLRSGDLATAMRASMSVPGAFTPVEIDNRVLIDGGIAQNLPVSVAFESDPDVVIAVDVGTSTRSADELTSAFGVLNQMLTLLIRRQTTHDIELLREQDLLIEPNLVDFGSTAFDLAPQAVPLGSAATEQHVERLRELALSEADWQRWESCRSSVSREPPVIDRIEVDTDGDLDHRVILSRLSARVGEPLDVDSLVVDLDRIYGLDHFQTVDFDLRVDEDSTTLVIRAPRAQFGTNYIRLAFDLSDDFEGDTAFDLGGRFTATELNRWGLELRADGLIGETQLISGELYQPIRGGHFFAAPRAGWQSLNARILVDGSAVAAYRDRGLFAALDVGRSLASWGELRLGYQYSDGKAEARVGDPAFESFDFSDSRTYLRLGVDTRDDPNFPHVGTYFEGSFDHIFESVLEERGTNTVWGSYRGFRPLRDWTIGVGLEAGTVLEDDRLVLPFRLGGFLRLSGLPDNVFYGRHLALADLTVYRTLFGDSLIGMPIIAGLSIETGNTWIERDDISASDLMWGGSLYAGVDSYLGPILLAWGHSEGGFDRVYFLVGRRF